MSEFQMLTSGNGKRATNCFFKKLSRCPNQLSATYNKNVCSVKAVKRHVIVINKLCMQIGQIGASRSASPQKSQQITKNQSHNRIKSVTQRRSVPNSVKSRLQCVPRSLPSPITSRWGGGEHTTSGLQVSSWACPLASYLYIYSLLAVSWGASLFEPSA